MIPVDWENSILDFDKTDSLQPIETLGCLPESDFNLAQPKWIIASLEQEKNDKINLVPGMI